MEENYRRQMGTVNNIKRLQIGVSEHTSRFGGNSDKSQCRGAQNYKFRGGKIIRKRCNRACTFCGTTFRFLQYNVPSTQKVRRVKTCDQPETTQPVFKNRTFQNGHTKQSVKPGKERRLGDNSGSSRRVFPHSNISTASQVSAVLHSGQSLSVPSIGLRAKNLPEGVHKSSFSGSSTLKNAKHQIGCLSGRLVSPECNSQIAVARLRENTQSSFSTRFSDKCRKVRVNTNTRHNLHRWKVFVGQRNSSSNSRQNCKTKGSNPRDKETIRHSKTVFTDARSDGFLHRGSTLCKTSYEADAIASTVLVETSVRRSRNADSKITTSGRSPKLVVTGSKHAQGQIVSSKRYKQNNKHRCVHVRLGRKFGTSDCPRTLATREEKLAHKLSRVGSCSFDNQKVSTTIGQSNSVDQIRQHNSCAVHFTPRGYEINSIVLQSLGTLEIGNRKQDRIETCTYSWASECFTRPAEQNLDSSNRMDSERFNSEENFSNLGEANDRSLCLLPEQENGPVLQLGTTSASLCGRCVLNNMGSNVCICVPANLSSSQGVGAHEAGALQNHSDSTPVAETSLVSRVTPAMCSKSNTSTNHISNVESTGISDISSQSQGIQSQCMVAINRQLSTKGFSQRVRDLLSASWRAGTQRDYSCKFRQFSSWCSQRQIDLYSASLAECAEFLTFLFHKGLQYRTIAGYRSMLSSVLQPIDNIPVGQHPYIIRLLKGTFNSRPPRVKLLPEWDLRLILKLLKKPPFEPLWLAPLKYLTWKSVFLVAITTFRRSSDIQALMLGGGNVSMQNRAITFIRQGLSKSDRPRHVNSKIVVPAFSEDKLLDPVRVLKCYLKRTKKFRNFGQDQAKMGLFLSFMEPHKPVTSQTIAKWLVRVIKLAYEDSGTKVKGHSTRAIGPSWALYNGASMSSILDAADWSKESTFVRFYLRDLNEAAVLKM